MDFSYLTLKGSIKNAVKGAVCGVLLPILYYVTVILSWVIPQKVIIVAIPIIAYVIFGIILSSNYIINLLISLVASVPFIFLTSAILRKVKLLDYFANIILHGVTLDAGTGFEMSIIFSLFRIMFSFEIIVSIFVTLDKISKRKKNEQTENQDT